MSDNIQEIKGMIEFPCHPKEKVAAYTDSHGHASIKCPTCGTYSIFNYDAMTATKAKALRGAVHKFKITQERNYID